MPVKHTILVASGSGAETRKFKGQRGSSECLKLTHHAAGQKRFSRIEREYEASRRRRAVKV